VLVASDRALVTLWSRVCPISVRYLSIVRQSFSNSAMPQWRPQRIHPDSSVACHEHGTALSGFLPSSWDHLDCQLWDHPARLAEGSSVGSLTAHVMLCDVEVTGRGISGGQCG